MSYTPGPWRQGGVKEFLLNNKCREICADEARIGLVYGISDEDNKANAMLVAAAPELLEALQKFVAWHDMDHETMTGVEVQKAYDQAINMAKGALAAAMRSETFGGSDAK